LLPHVRHNGSGQAEDTEEVCIEDQLGLFDRDLFRSGWRNAETGIVHKQVDTAGTPHNFLNKGIDGVVTVYVQRKHLERALTGRWDCPSAGAEYLVASLGQSLRRGFADA
jgi:hypothetical protein